MVNRNVERNLKILKDKGIIEREGTKRRGKGVVKKRNNRRL
jgi:predicted HTH transcriptional regulator